MTAATRIRVGAATAAFAIGLASDSSAELVGTTLVPIGATWSYLDDGSDAGTTWRAPSFPDGGWSAGPAELGYGDGDEDTVVASGPSGDRHITTYFRHHFNVTDPGSIAGLDLSILRDDGAVVYLNGTEVHRTNMPTGVVDHLTLSASTVSGGAETVFNDASIDPGLLVSGDNVIAVEIHQRSSTSSDISFDLDLVTAVAPSPLVRAPYLQVGTPTSIVVRWRTALPTESHVVYGPAPGSLTSSVTVAGSRTDHEVSITGLDPAKRYSYSVGTSAETFAGDDADHWFETSPPAGQRGPVRIWVIGDSGECAQNQQGCDDAGDVRDAYLNFAGSDIADVWLLLGDNAYTTGTDEQFTTGFFEVYPTVSRNTVVWPSPGNHEFGASDSPSQTGPYYDSFSMPTGGQAGGVASATEAFYSFDYGNVHFVALDSHDTDRSAPANPETNVCAAGQGGAMYQWLCADLAATTQDFVIVYWHHPPYTKGSHDSDDCGDSGGRMCDMRERFVPVLEHFGVDLQLTGHSHSYERSVLIDGQYGDSSECSLGECFLDGGDGDPDGDGAYLKAEIGPAPHDGAVYSVVGSSSKDSGGLSTHAVMAVGVNFEGSMVIDVVGRQLDGWWIDKNDAVADHFQILKGPALPVCDDGSDNDGDGLIDAANDPGCLGPLWPYEDPQCDDDLDNDGDGKVDWDGDPEGNGDGPALADPQCSEAWANRERRRSCGLGFEIALLLLPFCRRPPRRQV